MDLFGKEKKLHVLLPYLANPYFINSHAEVKLQCSQQKVRGDLYCRCVNMSLGMSRMNLDAANSLRRISPCYYFIVNCALLAILLQIVLFSIKHIFFTFGLQTFIFRFLKIVSGKK